MKKGKCIDCNKNPAAPKRRVCYTCKTKRDRQTNPIIIIYHNHKKNAKRRKKVFDIPLSYYKFLVISSGYIDKRGREAHSLTIDRIDNELGYIMGNMQVTLKSVNCSKGVKPEDVEDIYIDSEVDF